jgi:TrmH family RNA methyltransferase
VFFYPASDRKKVMIQLSIIQSVQNSMVKHAYSLRVPKKAKESEDFLCEGFHLVHEALASGLKNRYIFATKSGWAHPEGLKIFEEAQRAKVRCFEVTPKIVSYLSDTITPQGILSVVGKPAMAWAEKPYSMILALHQVQDAGNLGTLFRSAEAFGAQAVFLTEGSCDPFNLKAVRASMGSLFRIPFQVGGDWKTYMDWFKENGFHSYALSLKDSEDLSKVAFLTPVAFWVGSEGAGLPEDLAQSCEGRVSIPMAGKVESLNVGVAASLAMFWARFKGPVS